MAAAVSTVSHRLRSASAMGNARPPHGGNDHGHRLSAHRRARSRRRARDEGGRRPLTEDEAAGIGEYGDISGYAQAIEKLAAG